MHGKGGGGIGWVFGLPKRQTKFDENMDGERGGGTGP